MSVISQINFMPELWFRGLRSGGSGGQHVNKVSSKVELLFNVEESVLLTEEQKVLVFKKLRNRISRAGILRMVSQEERSQYRNKKLVIKKFYELLDWCLIKPIPRIPSKRTKAAKEKRLKKKKINKEKKEMRKKISQ